MKLKCFSTTIQTMELATVKYFCIIFIILSLSIFETNLRKRTIFEFLLQEKEDSSNKVCRPHALMIKTVASRSQIPLDEFDSRLDPIVFEMYQGGR